MKILFTGASSFTGMHFVQALLKDDHEVYCTFTKHSKNDYNFLQKTRIKNLKNHTHNRFGVEFGTSEFIDLIENNTFDIICHHGHVGQSAYHDTIEFDIVGALDRNTNNVSAIINLAKKKCVKKLILSGTYFQKRSFHEKSMNEYAVSKSLTFDVFEHYCDKYNLSLHKFFMPNPFGPYENMRFTSSAVKSWLSNTSFEVKEHYPVRDNIHVSLLSLCYAKFVSKIGSNVKCMIEPSGYVMTQGEFAKMFANEMQKRLKVPCQLTFSAKPTFDTEVRRNDFPAVDYIYGSFWDETRTWDALAEYYLSNKKFLLT